MHLAQKRPSAANTPATATNCAAFYTPSFIYTRWEIIQMTQSIFLHITMSSQSAAEERTKSDTNERMLRWKLA